MERASLYLQKMGVVLSGKMSHVNVTDARKATHVKGRGEDVS